MICPFKAWRKEVSQTERSAWSNISVSSVQSGAIKHMGEWRRGERGQSDDREVLDGVISETRAVTCAVILTISHKTVLLISMEELRWNWIHLALSLSLSFSLRWESNDPCNYYILWEDSQSSKASNLTVIHCPLHTHTRRHKHTFWMSLSGIICHWIF